eukprot:CAMPEP_0179101464 /NCGR_PEP_ID=MMETSP0796-20121207/46913_1 /TAXON_ID=73915 /ORGANISM="Pyrodinium bahamense, Strain pbaha01" /LENGTH=134 /DNA_ID=CAMNT_0020799315 /DNA_START=31 /DNA_END=432 /DNA_ORIENTATION=+
MGCTCFRSPGSPATTAPFAPVEYGAPSRGSRGNEAAVSVYGMAGDLISEVKPVPPSVLELKRAIEAHTGISPGQQHLVQGTGILRDNELLQRLPFIVTLVQREEETPSYASDILSNPSSNQIEGILWSNGQFQW